MKKFEEEVKRQSNAGIDPFSKRDVSFEKLSSKFTKGAQTLKEWKEYAFKAEDKIRELESQLEKQQPEIPYFVAEGIKSIPYHYTAFGAMLLVKEKIEITKGGDINSDWLPLYNWLFSNKEINSQDLFSQVWINGYTVAKEKRFYLKNKIELEEVGSDLIGYLNLFLTNGGYLTNNINRAKKFTKQEIDSMETGSYEQVEVEEK